MLVSGKTFPSPSKYCLTTLMTARFQISHETSDIILTCTWVCRGLDGSTCSESLPEWTCDFQPPEHMPRTSARAQTCVRGPGGLPACHGAESTRKDPRQEEKKMLKGQKNTFTYIQGPPSGCVLREIPGVTQVENGHAGNTAVATAYLCWVKHGHRSSRTGVPADYYH